MLFPFLLVNILILYLTSPLFYFCFSPGGKNYAQNRRNFYFSFKKLLRIFALHLFCCIGSVTDHRRFPLNKFKWELFIHFSHNKTLYIPSGIIVHIWCIFMIKTFWYGRTNSFLINKKQNKKSGKLKMKTKKISCKHKGSTHELWLIIGSQWMWLWAKSLLPLCLWSNLTYIRQIQRGTCSPLLLELLIISSFSRHYYNISSQRLD